MGSSPGFVCNRCDRRPVQTRFRSGCGCACLSLPHRLTRWLILQKARHQRLAPPLTACKHTVSGSISLPSPGFFSPFPHGTCALSVVKRIEPWRVDPPSSGGVSVSRRTRCQSGPHNCRLRGFHPLWRFFPEPSTGCARPYSGGLLRFRSPLLAEYFLFLRVLRCFSSPGSPRADYRFIGGYAGMPRRGFPHSDISGW